MSESKLRRAVLDPDQKALEVVFDSPGGTLVKVNYTWRSRDAIALPDVWWQAVVMESRYKAPGPRIRDLY